MKSAPLRALLINGLCGERAAGGKLPKSHPPHYIAKRFSPPPLFSRRDKSSTCFSRIIFFKIKKKKTVGELPGPAGEGSGRGAGRAFRSVAGRCHGRVCACVGSEGERERGRRREGGWWWKITEEP